MGPAPHYFPVDFILACHATFLILINIFQFVFSYLCITSYKLFSFSLFSKIYFFSVRDPIRDPIRDPNRDPIRDPVYDSIQFDPSFVDAEKRTIWR